jgi:lipopolysaccharide/colanic/teichoic acid biosynthesis glycosyltransferase
MSLVEQPVADRLTPPQRHPVVVARPATAYVRFVKPVGDRVGAAVALVLLAPVLAAVAVAVRVSMGPGVLYRQERVGRDGSTFTIVKFRSMNHDRRHAPLDRRRARRDATDRRLTHKHSDDPRHTTVGRFLRATSLDELPQLWNVLRGEMSLCGPRPELPCVVARYEPWQHQRHQVKPGLTGPWQLSGHRDEPMDAHTELDLEYLARVSLGYDLALLTRTVSAVLVRRSGV